MIFLDFYCAGRSLNPDFAYIIYNLKVTDICTNNFNQNR